MKILEETEVVRRQRDTTEVISTETNQNEPYKPDRLRSPNTERSQDLLNLSIKKFIKKESNKDNESKPLE